MDHNIPPTMLTQPTQMAPITLGNELSVPVWVCAPFISTAQSELKP